MPGPHGRRRKPTDGGRRGPSVSNRVSPRRIAPQRRPGRRVMRMSDAALMGDDPVPRIGSRRHWRRRGSVRIGDAALQPGKILASQAFEPELDAAAAALTQLRAQDQIVDRTGGRIARAAAIARERVRHAIPADRRRWCPACRVASTSMLAPGSRGAEPRSATTVTRTSAACRVRCAHAPSIQWPASGVEPRAAGRGCRVAAGLFMRRAHAARGGFSASIVRSTASGVAGAGRSGRQPAGTAGRAGIADGMKHRQRQHQRRLAHGLGSKDRHPRGLGAAGKHLHASVRGPVARRGNLVGRRRVRAELTGAVPIQLLAGEPAHAL